MNKQRPASNRNRRLRFYFTLVQTFLLISCSLTLSNLQAKVQERLQPKRYEKGADSSRKEGVPQGTVTTHQWLNSKIYPGTVRRYYVYVPKQYDAKKPAALMVFMDGHAYAKPDGEFRVPVVFDNLIHAGEMPVTIAVMIDPGHKKDKLPPKPGWRPQPENRAFEYDSLTDSYSKFVLEEILPEVEKEYNISSDPSARATCGSSSGGICAFTMAWERPDQFRRVISHIGSFVNIRGGDVYPGKIRKEKIRPMKILLQDGSNDLDNEHGNWPLANKQMFAALKFRKYDAKLVWGEGAHNGNHGGAIFPDSLRWLWRDFEFETSKPKSVTPDVQTAAWAVKWWQTRHDQKLKDKAEMKKVDLLFVGDSITHSWESTGKSTWEKFYAGRNAFNLGFSGDRTENVLWRLQNGAIDDIAPKVTVLMIGTNNTGHRQDKPEDTAAGIKAILGELRERLPETKILLLGIFPRGDVKNHKLRKINDATNEIIQGFADDEKVVYLNINDQFLDESGKLPKSVMPDLLHPNAGGYVTWAEAIEPQLKKMLDK